jgi:hypothetical protein
MQNIHHTLEILSMSFLIICALVFLVLFIKQMFRLLRQKHFSEFASNQEQSDRDTENYKLKIRLSKIEKQLSKHKKLCKKQ